MQDIYHFKIFKFIHNQKLNNKKIKKRLKKYKSEVMSKKCQILQFFLFFI